MLFKIIKSIKRKVDIKINPLRFANSIGVKVGKDCRFLSLTPSTFGSEPYLIKIGNHVTITSGVKFITHDGGVWVFRKEYPDIDFFGPIEVGNNVFIGINSVILPGVTIGNNTIIGAGSIINKDIPPNSVVAGVPAKYICSINDYFNKNEKNFTYIRSHDYIKKKKKLVKKFMRGSSYE